MCTNSKDNSISKGKEICLPNKESISGHGYERANMGTKCEIYINCSNNFLRLKKKALWLPNKEQIRDHGCESVI